MLMTWPTLLAKSTTSAAKATQTATDPAVMHMQNNSAASTLTAQSSVLDSAVIALGISNPQNQTPPKPHVASTGGNTGQLNYSYPLAVAPGPQGTMPTLAATYSSSDTNSRNSPFSPADSLGEGWELSMGAISENIEAGGTVWYSISGVDNVSDRLMANSSNPENGTLFATEHLSYLSIKMVTAGFDSQNCFHVRDGSGTYYEFGCTEDSMQYYTDSTGKRTNYLFDLNKVVPANDGNANRVINLTYLQVNHADSSGHNTIEDAGLKQITYGTTSNRAGTVDFLYKGPAGVNNNGVQWITAYGNNEGGCAPPDGLTTTQRCDDPLPKSGGLDDPLTKSVLSLMTVKTYVGDDSATSHLDYSYAFTYQDSAFYACDDPQSGTDGYCAGNHLLISITPSVYQNGTGHALPGVTLGYSADQMRLNKYEDTSHTVPQGGNYKVQTNWRYLTSYHDHSSGAGATILYHTAYNNSHGTPYSSSDGDNRYDPLYCVWHSGDCNSGTAFYPMYDKVWTEQVVYQITSIGQDSSASALAPQPTTYHYVLAKTTGSCPTDSQGNHDCVGFGWIPDSTDGWADFYHGEFRGFGEVDITGPSGNLTVQKYYATEGWDSPAKDATNYLAGSMYEEDDYQGSTVNSSGTNLLKQTTNVYAGTNGTSTACTDDYVSAKYSNCEVMLLSSKTTEYEQTGTGNTNAPWVQTADTYDDYSSSSGLISGKYHNKLSEVTTGSNIPTTTQNWTYQTTDTTVNSVVYYNVHSAIHTETVDAAGHKWSCSDTTYDQGEPSAVPSPAAGWATTTKTYSNCADSTTATTTYTGYDVNGDAVATVDGVGVANPGLYSTSGCTLSTAPAYMASAWTASHYTTCTAYDPTSGLNTDSWNAFSQHTSATYDATQGLMMTSSTDVNGQVTTQSESYDSSGNTTTSVKNPAETASYSEQGTLKATCTDSSTLPCSEEDGNNSLYSNAVTHTFYDSTGRKVETQTPGPDASHTTVTFTVYNDTAATTFTSQPFVVAARSTWLDPNGAVDINGNTPGGASITIDAAGRTLTSTDELGQVTTTIYGLGTAAGSGDTHTYALTTDIDSNNHVQLTYTDASGNHVYVVDDSGLYGGTLTPNRLTATQYNAINKPTNMTVTDLAPQSGQTITSVTTTTAYDDLGRMTRLVDPDRGTHTYTYDANGHMTSDTSGSRVNGTSYDLLGRAGCVQDAAPTSVDVHGACSSGVHPFVQDTYDATPAGVTTNNIGRLTQAVTTTYYPAPDNATGTVTESMQYDARGRMTTKGLQIGFSGGSIAFPTFPQYQETMTYNDADQSMSTQTTTGGQPGYVFSNAYDSTTGVLNGVSNNTTGAPTLASLSYNAQNLVSDVMLKDDSTANLADEHLNYDGDLRVANSSTAWVSGGATIYSDGLSYDPAGNVISRTSTQASVAGVSGSGGSEVSNFCYDEQNRMVWASNTTAATAGSAQTCGTAALSGTLGDSYTSSYTFTHLGQLWQGPLNGGSTQEQYLYCSTGHPHQVTALSPVSGSPTCSSPGTADYSANYDAFGNVIGRTYPATTTGQPVYNSQDQMVTWSSTTPTNSQGEWYLYDSTGNRVLRRSASTTSGGNPSTAAATITVYAFGLEEHTYQYSGSGSSANNSNNTYYFSLNGKLLGTLSGASTLTTNFLLTDSVGSVVSTISNAAGSAAVQGNQVYGPYGNKRYSAGNMGTAKGFTGQYADDLTGFDYYVARYYDPVSARFLSADTVQGDMQGMDPYDYVGGNPETRNDPSGHCWPLCTMLIGAAIGALVGGGVSAVSQLASGNGVNWGEVGKQAVVGAISGAVAGLAGPEAGVLTQAAVGAASGAVGQAASNVMNNKPIGDGVGQAAAIGGATGGLAAAAGPLVEKVGSAIASNVGSAATDAASTATDAASTAASACGLSFSANTPIATPNGEKAIDTLHIGDLVQAFNPATKTQSTQTVQNVFINHDTDLIDVTLALKPIAKSSKDVATGKKQQDVAVASHGSHAPPVSSKETIHTTQKHPWLTTKGWITAGNLRLGDQVLRLDGETATVVALKVVPGEQDMYDLTVSNVHTFVVGTGLYVVHNCINQGLAQDAQSVAKTLESTVPAGGRGFVTTAAGVLQDAQGNVIKVASISPEASTGVKDMVEATAGLFGHDFINGSGHAEANIVNYAEQNQLKLLAVGTSRQACVVCTDFMSGYFDVGETNLNLLPRSHRPSLWWNV
jgi:RHS repeat-associated protein